MAENKFKIFDENATNVQTDAEYATDLQRLDGVTPGKARSVLHNKLFRQVSIMASALGQVIAEAGAEANDSSFTNLVNAIKNTFKKSSSIAFDNNIPADQKARYKAENIQDALVEIRTYELRYLLKDSWTYWADGNDGGISVWSQEIDISSSASGQSLVEKTYGDFRVKQELGSAVTARSIVLKNQREFSKINRVRVRESSGKKYIEFCCYFDKPNEDLSIRIEVE